MEIIVNADDFGRSQIINKAIAEAFDKHFIQQTTIMANMPSFDEAVQLSKDYGFFDRVGLHINLDEGTPITCEMKENQNFCTNGIYHGHFFQVLKNRFVLNKRDKESIECELIAQMNKYINAGFTLMHYDSHHFVHNNISVYRVVKKLGLEREFRSARITEYNPSDSFFKHLYKVFFNKLVSRDFQTTRQFIQNLSNYEENRGSCELMTHPFFIEGNLVDVLSWEPLITKSFEEHYSIIRNFR